MSVTATWLRVRREYYIATTEAVHHCDACFVVARGAPRHGALRARLEEKRAARLAPHEHRATPDNTP